MAFRIVIPSAKAENLISCVRAICACEPRLSPSDIIVVDDGARADSEGLLPPLTWLTGTKPFIFARNVNLGIHAAGEADVILLNDDARLQTPSGFTVWARLMDSLPYVGICSAGIRGVVCNQEQAAHPERGIRLELAPKDPLAFICVYLPRVVIAGVGPLDERFVGYGFDDFDYCRRVTAAGFRLAIWDGCVVDHAELPSTYRTRPDLPRLYVTNRALYEAKWAGGAP